MSRELRTVIVVSAVVLGLGFASSKSGFGESLGSVTLTKVTPRVITPDGDNANDVVFINFDTTLTGLPIDTAVMDVSGAKVSGLRLSSSETALTWDGRDDSGRVLPSGIYIYSIRLGRHLATGTVVVAK